jgi:hypothetical protein
MFRQQGFVQQSAMYFIILSSSIQIVLVRLINLALKFKYPLQQDRGQHTISPGTVEHSTLAMHASIVNQMVCRRHHHIIIGGIIT